MVSTSSGSAVLSAAHLVANKKHQLIRIVNASDFTVQFKFKTDLPDRSFVLYPKTGSILPKGYCYVSLERLDGKSNSFIGKLRFIYRRVNCVMMKHIPKSMNIDLVGNSVEKRNTKNSSILSVALRLVRSLLLLLLIIYNVILIISYKSR